MKRRWRIAERLLLATSPRSARRAGASARVADSANVAQMLTLSADDPRWMEFLSGVPHDHYHWPEYVRMFAEAEGGTAEAVLIRSGRDYFFMSYIVRALSQVDWLGSGARGLYDLTSPYGYSGPLLSPGSDYFHCQAVRTWSTAMWKRHVVSGFTRLHPLLSQHHQALTAAGVVKRRGQTVSIDLTLSLAELWQQTRANHRNEISQARRAGVTAAMVDDYHAALDIFIPMYYDTMRRAGASASYMFPREYFVQLKRVLGDQLFLCLVRSPDGQAIGGGLFTECQGIVQYHLSAATDSAARFRPAKLMIDFVRSWAKDRGNHTFHLGGGVGAKHDSLFEFKSRFSPLRHDFFTWQLIFMPEVYMDLERRRRKLDVPLDDVFFPIYRG